MSKRIDQRLWGVLGKQKTYFSPQKQVEGKSKTPLNANAFDSWDAKRSRFKRVDGYENAIQQGGTVIGQQTTPSVSSTPQPTPSITPTLTNTPTPSSTPQPTPTPSITPSLTPNYCREYTLQGDPFGTNFNWTNCDGTTGSTALFGTTITICAINGSVSQSAQPGTITPGGNCSITPTPTSTPTYTPTPSTTPPIKWNTNTTNWESETQNWENA